MPMNRRNTRTFQRRLYAGELETITLLKRNDDQQQGVVTKYTLFGCRKSRTFHSGEPIAGDIASNDHATWHIFRIELDRVGVDHINAADRIVDKFGRYWQPEANTEIRIQLFENVIDVDCLRIDPPGNVVQPVRMIP